MGRRCERGLNFISGGTATPMRSPAPTQLALAQFAPDLVDAGADEGAG